MPRVSHLQRDKDEDPWTADEDSILLNAKERNGLTLHIASHIPGRTNEQCRQRSYYDSCPTKIYKKGSWTQEEDDAIVSLQGQHGNRWTTIAKHLPDRSENCIKNC